MRHAIRQEGFTLIEMLVAMALALVLFGATVSVLDVYNRRTTENTQRNDAADQGRVGIDRMARQLRNIASDVTSPKLMERATGYDIVFQTTGPAPSGTVNLNATGDERVRYCVPDDTASGTPSQEVLVQEVQTWTSAAAPASPWTSDPTVTLPCPDASLPPSTTEQAVVQHVTNRLRQRTDRPLFSFNGSSAQLSDPTQATTVQFDLFVNPTPGVTKLESELRSSAYLRNDVRAPVAGFSPSNQGGGVVLLNGGASYSPDGYDLSYAWSCAVPSPCPNAASLTNDADGLVSWAPGPGTYTIQLVVTDSNGLASSPYSLAVTVR